VIDYVEAGSQDHIETVRELFIEYAESLNFSLRFQNFEQELKTLPGEYKAPEGNLYLAFKDGKAIGCVGVRRITDEVCEMKRLYVKPEHRRKGIGKRLSEIVIEKARGAGYRRMRLDTISKMKEAMGLYSSLGFEKIEPYCYNPIEGAIFMELELL
jgi:putative acetyltransferase